MGSITFTWILFCALGWGIWMVWIRVGPCPHCETYRKERDLWEVESIGLRVDGDNARSKVGCH